MQILLNYCQRKFIFKEFYLANAFFLLRRTEGCMYIFDASETYSVMLAINNNIQYFASI